MNSTIHVPLDFTGGEFAILAELLESERAKLLIEIRHTHHRSFRRSLTVHRVRLTQWTILVAQAYSVSLTAGSCAQAERSPRH